MLIPKDAKMDNKLSTFVIAKGITLVNKNEVKPNRAIQEKTFA